MISFARVNSDQWDDEPTFISNTTDITLAPPIFSPYHHFDFSEGYVYAPRPAEPYQPVSKPHLAVFLTNGTGASNAVTGGYIHPGEIGSEVTAMDAFWFNAFSVYLGCDNAGPDVCRFEISGYTFTGFSEDEVLAYQQNATTSPCPSRKNCQLEQVIFPSEIKGLSGLQIRAFVGEEQRIWFMDNLELGWYNTSCAAGLQRAQAPRR